MHRVESAFTAPMPGSEQLITALHELTDGRGVDHVVEVGGPGTLQQSIEAVRLGGNILMLGVLTGFGEGDSYFCIDDDTDQVRGILVGSLQGLERVTRRSRPTASNPSPTRLSHYLN